MPRWWLVKSEPEVFSIDDFARDRVTGWEGVRNYQARNSMRDEMQPGELVLFYHSNADPSGVAGVGRVVRNNQPDPTQFDAKSEYFDATSPADAPRWVMVELEFVQKFSRLVSLDELKTQKALKKMPLMQKGQRLSVQPCERAHFEHVVSLAALTPVSRPRPAARAGSARRRSRR